MTFEKWWASKPRSDIYKHLMAKAWEAALASRKTEKAEKILEWFIKEDHSCWNKSEFEEALAELRGE